MHFFAHNTMVTSKVVDKYAGLQITIIIADTIFLARHPGWGS